MAGASGWRVNDVVEYDRMRAAATTLTGLLLHSPGAGDGNPDAARAEAVRLRHEVLTVGAFDRAAVVALAARIQDRIAVLTAVNP